MTFDEATRQERTLSGALAVAMHLLFFVLLVVGIRLGCLNHALLAAEAASMSLFSPARVIRLEISGGGDDCLAAVEALCARWELECSVIGEVVEGDHLICTFGDEVVGDIPVSALVDDCPRYERRLADVAWVHGSAITPPTPDEVPGLDDGSAAAVLDEAEAIVNAIGFDLMAQIEAEQNTKRRWWRRKK